MTNMDIIVGIIIIIIPLTLLVLWYRTYTYNICKDDLKCILSNANKNLKKSVIDIINPQVEEGFFGGLTDWFSGNSISSLPISPGSLEPENLSILEKKINDKMKKSDVFPPNELQGNSDDFKDSDNNSILGSAGTVIPAASFESTLSGTSSVPSAAPVAPKINIKPIPKQEPIIQKPDFKSILGSCQFYSDKCPSNHQSLGNFTIQGMESNSILSCGNIINTKPGKAVAQIKNNSVYEIHIIDPGHGYLPTTIPKVRIEGGKGHGATAEAVIDDDGFLKLIKVTDKGYNYAETPNVFIDPPMMNSSCHLCCDIP